MDDATRSNDETDASERPRRDVLRFLRRETSTGQFLPEIDGLRFIAILAVLLYHVYMVCSITVGGTDASRPLMESVFEPGNRGVLLFFCISGFILGLPFARRSFADGPAISLPYYFTRRLTRLEPPYLLNLLIRLPLVMVAKHLAAKQALPHLLASVFYVHTLVYGEMPLIHLPSWSLEVEVQFYILAPFVATALFRASLSARRYGALLLTVATVALQWRIGFSEGANEATRASFSILNFFQFFLAGLVAADLYFTAKPAREADPWLDAVGAFAVAAFFFTPSPYSRFLLPFLGLAIVWSALRSRRFRGALSKPFVYIVGGMCYSLYLTHSLVLQIVFAAMAKLRLVGSMPATYALGALLSLPAVLLVGGAFYALIERPCMDRRWPSQLVAAAQRLMGRKAAG